MGPPCFVDIAKGLGGPFHEMKPGTVLFLHLFHRKNLLSKVSELGEFFLNVLQTFVPLAMSDLGFCVIAASKPIALVQLLNLSDF